MAAEAGAFVLPLTPPPKPRRTVRRWLAWWRTTFVASALWRELRARFAEPPDETWLPASLLARLGSGDWLLSAARLLSPLATGSVLKRSGFAMFVM